MTTIGEQVIERINGIERRLDLFDRLGVAGGVGVPTDAMQELQSDLEQLRNQMEELKTSPSSPAPPKQPNDPKDWMPETLAHQYKDRWRNWSYKTRDWLSQHDSTLPEKTRSGRIP